MHILLGTVHRSPYSFSSKVDAQPGFCWGDLKQKLNHFFPKDDEFSKLVQLKRITKGAEPPPARRFFLFVFFWKKLILTPLGSLSTFLEPFEVTKLLRNGS